MLIFFGGVIYFAGDEALRVLFKRAQAGLRTEIYALPMIIRAGIFFGLIQFSAANREDGSRGDLFHVQNYSKKSLHNPVGTLFNFEGFMASEYGSYKNMMLIRSSFSRQKNSRL